MAFLDSGKVQTWLEDSKFPVAVVSDDFETLAAGTVKGKLEARYDTSTWVDEATSPALVIDIMAMLVASYELRKAISEDDGESSYPKWLEARALQLCDDILSGAIELEGFAVDTDSTLGSGVEFFPTDASTELFKTLPSDEGATPQYIRMNEVF